MTIASLLKLCAIPYDARIIGADGTTLGTIADDNVLAKCQNFEIVFIEAVNDALNIWVLE